jgi:hypothetical protein
MIRSVETTMETDRLQPDISVRGTRSNEGKITRLLSVRAVGLETPRG